MEKHAIILSLFSFLFFAACSQDTTDVKKYSIGDLKLKIRSTCFTPCNQPIAFLNLHEDEQTSVAAAEDFLTTTGGILVELKHNGNRNLTFKSNNQSYSFDPNRMFTPLGRKASMQLLGRYNTGAALLVKSFAESLLQDYILGKKMVIALHNNRDSTLSILSYTNKKLEGKNAAKVFINEAMDPDDFILTTEPELFSLLKEKEINVVLQSKNAVDDGSLSVYAAKQNIPYINVEAEHGHTEEQTRMLTALKEIFVRDQSPATSIGLRNNNAKKH